MALATLANSVGLEQRLRTLAQTKGLFDADVRTTRLQLKVAYEAILLEDYALAQVRHALHVHDLGRAQRIQLVRCSPVARLCFPAGWCPASWSFNRF